jgi:hypothetical protein
MRVYARVLVVDFNAGHGPFRLETRARVMSNEGFGERRIKRKQEARQSLRENRAPGIGFAKRSCNGQSAIAP